MSLFATDYDLGGRFGLGLGAGVHEAQNSDLFKDTSEEEFVAGLWFRYHLSSSWALELSYDQFKYKNDQPKNGALDLSLALRMWSNKRFRLLVQIGAGMMQVKDYPGFSQEAYDAFTGKGRLGFEYMLSQNWAMGLNADYHYVDVKKTPYNEFHIFAPMLGFTFYFGGTEEVRDSDGDGIDDPYDKCPNTMAGLAIDAEGCPLKKEKAIVDSDYDGVPDSDDHCPSTEMGKQVNPMGCSAREKIEFTLNVQFETSRWVVRDKYKGAMEEFAKFMAKYPDTKAEIAGHSDNTGNAQYNYSLSQKRAEAVRLFLINNFAIAPERLTAKGYGPSQPIADNNTLEGREKNRRVVATIETEVE